MLAPCLPPAKPIMPFFASIVPVTTPFIAVALLSSLAASQGVPIVDLPAAKARTSVTFGAVLGVNESGNRVLVNDPTRRQLFEYDTTLTKVRIVFDSVGGTPNSYGSYRMPLLRWLGDSTMVPDIDARSVLVLNAQGNISRTFALPHPMDVGSLMGSAAFPDDKGRVLYTAAGYVVMPKAGTVGPQEMFPDSIPLLRSDLDARRVDTIARLAKPKGEYSRIDLTDPAKVVRTLLVNPLPVADQWAVISDGSVAVVRGYDYHVDWIRSDGTKSSTAKLPFDWKRVTEEEKQKLIDSTLEAHAAQNKLAAETRNAPPPPPPPPAGEGSTQRTAGGAGVSRAAYDAGGRLWVPLDFQVVSPKDIPDYYPAIREGAVVSDNDNHLWVLPSTSAQSRNGELIYDVINTKGELFQRVRVPLGRIVAGFGKGGVVYLIEGSKTKGFYLERTRLPSK